jgi:hypothetical protein
MMEFDRMMENKFKFRKIVIKKCEKFAPLGFESRYSTIQLGIRVTRANRVVHLADREILWAGRFTSMYTWNWTLDVNNRPSTTR